jgi:hypothetical protein
LPMVSHWEMAILPNPPIFNPLTCDLESTHPQPIGVIVLVLPFCMMALAMANFCFLEEPLWCYLSVCRCSRLVCGVTFSVPGMGNDKYVIHTLVHSTGSGANGVFLLLPVAHTNPLVCYQIVLMMCHWPTIQSVDPPVKQRIYIRLT